MRLDAARTSACATCARVIDGWPATALDAFSVRALYDFSWWGVLASVLSVAFVGFAPGRGLRHSFYRRIEVELPRFAIGLDAHADRHHGAIPEIGVEVRRLARAHAVEEVFHVGYVQVELLRRDAYRLLSRLGVDWLGGDDKLLAAEFYRAFMAVNYWREMFAGQVGRHRRRHDNLKLRILDGRGDRVGHFAILVDVN